MIKYMEHASHCYTKMLFIQMWKIIKYLLWKLKEKKKKKTKLPRIISDRTIYVSWDIH